MSNTCSTGCGKLASRRGMCQPCYRRFKRNGTTERVGQKPPISIAVVMANVEVANTGCMIWTGDTDKDGRPRYYDGERYQRGEKPLVYVQRWMYEYHGGVLKKGQTLTRDCPNKRLCVNHTHSRLWRDLGERAFGASKEERVVPDLCANGHPLDEEKLYTNPVTGAWSCRQCSWESKLRSQGIDPATRERRSHNREKTHCYKGHPLDGDNVWINREGNRVCKRCRAEVAFRQNLKKEYGLTVEGYLAMLKAQDDQCGICDRSFAETGGQINVDHCHRTGKVRGLLCRSCNLGIGHFDDNLDVLQRAIAYLRRQAA
ncbi:endonuclease VII domain-containing protein [Streptomyces mirabilis]|uniref:endonuclease VII domain-containing protein n=1 Tax=Streptomyces mirabilis TaxID=68239 RepID=UPI0033A1FC38